VWGARGFIGHALVADLCSAGWQVRALSRGNPGPSALWDAEVEWRVLGVAGRDVAFDQAIDGCDVVFNLAGTSGAVASNQAPLESLDGNCRIQLEFLTACARARVTPHVVFASSRLVYAQSGRTPVTESHATAPRSVYAAHKLCVEHYHRIFAERGAITFTICRISNPFGIDGRAGAKGYGFINDLVQRAAADEPMRLFGRGSQLRDYIYIADLSAGLRLCADVQAARNRVFNLGRGVSVSVLDAAEAIGRCFGTGRVEFEPWPEEFAMVESGDFVMDVSQARTELKFHPIYSLYDGLLEIRDRLTRCVASVAPGRFAAPRQRLAPTVGPAAGGR
jgi:UDP-glucose 4-epimerase